jgi:hypothetical protein
VRERQKNQITDLEVGATTDSSSAPAGIGARLLAEFFQEWQRASRPLLGVIGAFVALASMAGRDARPTMTSAKDTDLEVGATIDLLQT